MYNPIDRINSQIAELEKMKSQIPMQPITQNFQFANNGIRYADSIDEVEKSFIVGDTPFFSKDLSVVWIKSINGIKSYELKEIVKKDEKDLLIESLQMQIEEMKGKQYAKSNDEYVDESIKDKKSSNVPTNKLFKTK